MLRAFAHQGFMIAALVVGATATGTLSHALITGRGALGPLIFQAESVPLAIGAVVAAIVIATVLAIGMARIANSAVGLFVMGGVLFGMAWRTETVDELARLAQQSGGSNPLWGACIEDVVLAVMLAIASTALFRIGGPLPDVEPDEEGRVPSAFVGVGAGRMLAAGVALLPVVWVIARTTSRGQLIGAAVCGAMVAGLAARLLAPHVQPVLVVPGVMLAAAIGHAWVAFRVGADLPALAHAGAVPALGRPMPLQYAAGAAMGVGMGLGWAKSFLHHEE